MLLGLQKIVQKVINKPIIPDNLQQLQQNQEELQKGIPLGDRMKMYEKASRSYINSQEPIIARLDGHSFSKFTKGLEKPFDKWLHDLMVETTGHLHQQYSVDLSYTQSDEITLVFLPKKNQNYGKIIKEGKVEKEFLEFQFANQIQKFVSLSAANATNYFTRGLSRKIQTGEIDLKKYKENIQQKLQNPECYFDCRIFNVPTIKELENNLMWRNIDCMKNSISIAGHSYLGHKKMDYLNSTQKIEALKQEANIDWYQYSSHLKYGTYIKKQLYQSEIKEEYMKFKKNKKNPQQNNDQQDNLCIRSRLIGFSVEINMNNKNQQVLDLLLSKQLPDNEQIQILGIDKEFLEQYEVKI